MKEPASVSYEFVIYEKRDHVAYVTFNRPDVMNAMHGPMHQELSQIWADFAADDDLWIAVVTGSGGRAFSTGNDLRATAERSADLSDDATPEVTSYPPGGFAGMTFGYNCTKPILAKVAGYALGGGFEVALACDIIVAADDAQFALPEARVGIVPSAGGIHRLLRKIPYNQAMSMILTGRRMSADEAFRAGLVSEVVPAGELEEAVDRWIEQILLCSPFAIQLTKEMLQAGLNRPVDEAILDDRASRLPRLFASEDFIEGPRAFVEKRKPVWVGR